MEEYWEGTTDLTAGCDSGTMNRQHGWGEPPCTWPITDLGGYYMQERGWLTSMIPFTFKNPNIYMSLT